jgi:hypothetical protein
MSNKTRSQLPRPMKPVAQFAMPRPRAQKRREVLTAEFVEELEKNRAPVAPERLVSMLGAIDDLPELYRRALVAMAEIADTTIDDSIRLRALAWLRAEAREDALMAAEGRAREAEAKYSALLEDVKKAFSESKQIAAPDSDKVIEPEDSREPGSVILETIFECGPGADSSRSAR